MRIQRKILSAILICTLLFSRSFVFAQDVPNETLIETPTPTEELPTPTPTDDPSFDEHNTQEEFSDSNEEATGPDAENLDPQDTTDIISSHSATIDVVVENNNNADVDKNSQSTNSTGSNQAIANVDLYNNLIIKTGDAAAQENHTNILNTNIIGEHIIPAIINFFTSDSTSSYDYSDVESCTNQSTPILSADIQLTEADGNKINITDIYQREDTLGITNNNTAHVVNTITVDALTGDNKTLENIASTSIDTGDASIDVNLFNLVNTNLIGECGFFGIFNFFGPQTNSLILPNDDDFIQHNSEQSTLSSVNIINNNEADIATETNANTNTGENNLSDSINWLYPPLITTGNSETNQDILDLTNLNYTINNFAILRIQHFGHWTGKLIGWDGLIYEGDDYILLIKDNNLADNFNSNEEEFEGEQHTNEFLNGDQNESIVEIEKHVVIDNNNDAYLRNNLFLNADTGHNEANKINAEIETGNALIETDIFNMLNTNITGRNWYFGIINIFDTFTGDIIFPRADVSVAIDSDKSTIQSNDIYTYRIQYANTGQLPADNVSLVAIFPSDTKILSTTKQGTKSGQTMSWSLGSLQKDVSGTIYVQVQVNSSNDPHTLMATTVIHTSTKEVETENNSASASVIFKSGSSVNTSTSGKNETSNQTSSAAQVTPTPTVTQTTTSQNNPYSPLNNKIAGISSDNGLSDQEDTTTDQDKNKSNGKISLNGISKTYSAWGPLVLAYFLGVASTLLALRIKRIFLT